MFLHQHEESWRDEISSEASSQLSLLSTLKQKRQIPKCTMLIYNTATFWNCLACFSVKSCVCGVPLRCRVFSAVILQIPLQFPCETLRCLHMHPLDSLAPPYLHASLQEVRCMAEWDRIPKTTPWETTDLREASMVHNVRLRCSGFMWEQWVWPYLC